MILSNIEIHKAIDEGRLIITPDPQPRNCEEAGCPYDTTAVDLHLSKSLAIPKAGPYVFDLRQGRGQIAKFLAENSEKIEIPAGGYVLEPHKFVLGNTKETIKLPIEGGLAARIEGKSSFARCGLLVHFTAPTVHAGFDGTLTLEMMNLGNVGIALWEDMAISQLILEAVSGNPQEHPSQFQGQATPAGTTKK
jgi:dCTP deaminase